MFTATAFFSTQFDPDAELFFNASGLNDPTAQAAVNQLVLDFKTIGIWTKMLAIYPIVGGTADLHKWNLKDPRNLDAAFRLSFSGSMTHSSTGILFGGGVGDTFLNPSTTGGTSWHMSIYARNNVVGDHYDMGLFTAGSEWALISRYTGNVSYATFNSSFSASAASTDARGFWLGSVVGSVTTLYKNATSLDTGTGFTNFNSKIGLGGQVGRGSSFYTRKQLAFGSIGRSLTATEVTNMNTAVQNFQTTLGRKV
jgi:hypothetical protein